MDEGVLRVKAALEVHGLGDRLQTFSASTHTAYEAASALGVELGQIAKSIVFKVSPLNRAVIVVTRGDRRVNQTALERYLGVPVERGTKDWVRDATGYPVGGVSPIGGKSDVEVLIDSSITEYAILYAAAGDAHTVFKVSPAELQSLTGAPVVENLGEPS